MLVEVALDAADYSNVVLAELNTCRANRKGAIELAPTFGIGCLSRP